MELYNYRLSGYSVLDGDTIAATVELGFDVVYRANVRVQGIDTPEKTGRTKKVGLAVADWLGWLLGTYGPLTLISTCWDKYGGRVDGKVFINAPGRDPLSVADVLLRLGMAQPLGIDGKRSRWQAKSLAAARTAAAKRNIDPWEVMRETAVAPRRRVRRFETR